MTDVEAEHGPDCTCFKCKIGSLSFKSKPRTKFVPRPVDQPNDPVYTERRPDGSEVPVLLEGRQIRVSEARQRQRQLDELKRASHNSLAHAHDQKD